MFIKERIQFQKWNMFYNKKIFVISIIIVVVYLMTQNVPVSSYFLLHCDSISRCLAQRHSTNLEIYESMSCLRQNRQKLVDVAKIRFSILAFGYFQRQAKQKITF